MRYPERGPEVSPRSLRDYREALASRTLASEIQVPRITGIDGFVYAMRMRVVWRAGRIYSAWVERSA